MAKTKRVYLHPQNPKYVVSNVNVKLDFKYFNAF